MYVCWYALLGPTIHNDGHLSHTQMLECLVAAKDIDWSKVTCFHLDEYIGIDQSHGASFVK